MTKRMLILVTVLLLLVGCGPYGVPLPDSGTQVMATIVAGTTSVPSESEGEGYGVAWRPGYVVEPAVLDGMTHYELEVELSDDMKTLLGHANIRYTNREVVPLDAIYVQLYPNLWGGGLELSDVSANGRSVIVTPTGREEVARIPLEETLQPGDRLSLGMDFTIAIPSGDGLGNYGEFAYLDDVLALAHFYPTIAVYDSGWRLEAPAAHGDVIFHDASLYSVTLRAPEELTVVATGETLGRQENGDGTATWTFAGGPMRDFNLVASERFKSSTREAGDVTVTSYFLPGHEEGGEAALAWAATALETFDAAFGPYPYNELDIAETATTAGGIEYPGLVVLASDLYASPARSDFFELATAHEVAHQWWYNVVGNDQRSSPWLDESLAQYSTYLYFRNAYGPRGGEEFLASMAAWRDQGSDPTMPIGLAANAYSPSDYGPIVYGRGPLFFMALAETIGEARMAELLQSYYQTYHWGIGTPAGFQSLAESLSGADLDSLFEAWLLR